MSIYERTLQLVNEAATALERSGASAFTSAQIQAWIRNHRPSEWMQISTSFQPHFSKAVNNSADCLVERIAGTFQYRVAAAATPAATIDDLSMSDDPATCQPPAATEADFGGRVERERALYAFLRDWLIEQDYSAQVTASSRKGGVWGNPDVTGLKIHDIPGASLDVECVTIEAKLSDRSWRTYIFEAVAHKRFAHRAWFAFAVGTDQPGRRAIPEANKLCEYAEKYGVGILVIFVRSAVYERLASGDASQVVLDPDDADILTLWPAMYDPVQTPALSEYLTEVLRIRGINDFTRFGNDAE